MPYNVHYVELKNVAALKAAVIANDINTVKSILNSNDKALELILDINTYNDDPDPIYRRVSALYIALKYGNTSNYEIFLYMISLLPNVNIVDAWHLDIIAMTILERNEYMLDYLLTHYDYNPISHYEDNGNYYPIAIAAARWPAALWKLISYGFSVDFFLPRDYGSVITILLEHNPDMPLEQIIALVNIGAPLYGLAMHTNRLDLWQLSIDYNVDLSYRPFNPKAEDFDALFFALKLCNFPVSFIKQLLVFMRDEALLNLEYHGDHGILVNSYLVALAANQYYNAETKLEIAKLLLQHGANLYIKYNVTAVHVIVNFYMAYNNNLLIKYLILYADQRIVDIKKAETQASKELTGTKLRQTLDDLQAEREDLESLRSLEYQVLDNGTYQTMTLLPLIAHRSKNPAKPQLSYLDAKPYMVRMYITSY